MPPYTSTPAERLVTEVSALSVGSKQANLRKSAALGRSGVMAGLSGGSFGGARGEETTQVQESQKRTLTPMSAPPLSAAEVFCSASSWLIWVGFVVLPLALTSGGQYVEIFPEEWRPNTVEKDAWPAPLGLCLGILAVIVGHVFLVAYHWLHRIGTFGATHPIQMEGAPPYKFGEGLATHLMQPEGFVLLGGYLAGTWMFKLMPTSYYSFEGGIVWWQVLAQLALQDLVQYLMHRIEHSASPYLYKLSHKPHHRFVNPKLFDAFNGSAADTFLMILCPLYVTANLINCNVWTYMAFGSLYANWLTLIHSEYPHSWDPLFRKLGLGTAADHHVHHKLFKYNFGHLFLHWDMVAGTYRDPTNVRVFNKGV